MDAVSTMMHMTLMFRVAHAHKAKKELQRTEELLNEKLEVGKCEQYWKIPELWTCDACIVFDAPSASEQIAGVLLRANRLANGWYVLGPFLRSDGGLETFTGIFTRRKADVARIQSLEWANFHAP